MANGKKSAGITGRTTREADRPTAEQRAWAGLGKAPNAGKMNNARKKVPFGPVGGSGRKTNLSRSS